LKSYWLREIDHFVEISEKWDSALLLSKADRPYLMSDLIIIWWNIFRVGKKLRIFIIEDDESNIIAGFPLYISISPIRKGGFRKISQIGDGFANCTEPFFLIPREDFEKKFIFELNKLSSWEFADFPRIRNNFFSMDGSQQLSCGNRALVDSDTNPIITISMDAESYLKTRSKKFRSNVRYYRKKATEVGEISLMQMSKIDDIINVANLFIDFSIESRKTRAKSGYNDNDQADFVRSIVRAFAEKSIVDAHVLYFGEEIAAVSIGWRYGPGYKYILPSYNPKYSNISPGYSLIYALIDYAKNNGDPYFDMFSGGEVFYKSKWCNYFPPILVLKVYKDSLIGLIAYAFQKVIRSIKRYK
jgi:CelD/BcsL family acetyltransferase involved in cellulose biosynthesis